MEAGHELPAGTRDLVDHPTPPGPMLDDGRDRGETPVGIVDLEAPPPRSVLLPADEDLAFAQRWRALEACFADEPRRTVEHADELVAEIMVRLADCFADARERLEAQWDRGGDVPAEDLGAALERYRWFFRRLLSS